MHAAAVVVGGEGGRRGEVAGPGLEGLGAAVVGDVGAVDGVGEGEEGEGEGEERGEGVEEGAGEGQGAGLGCALVRIAR